MSFFRKRPLFCFALSFYTAACMLYSFGAVSRIAFSAVALLISAIAVILSCKIPRFRACRTAIVAASLGILAAAAFSAYNIDVNYARLRRLSGENDTITGVIEHVGYTASYGGYYTVGVTASERGLAGRRLLLSADDGELYFGDTVICNVVLSSLEENAYFDELDARRTYLPDGVVLFAENTAPVKTVRGGVTASAALGRLRSRLGGIITAGAGEDSGGLLSALLLGDTSHLPATAKRDFRVLGISHLLALSGTHLTVLFSGLARVISSRFRGALRIPFTVIPVVFYMALTGFSPSVTRAGIMFILCGCGGAMLRGYDAFTGLGAAGLVICAKNSWAPYDIGLLLSASAMLTLLIIGRENRSQREKATALRRFLQSVRTAFLVPLVMLPLLCVLFGEVSVVSAPANILLAPVVGLLIPLALVVLLLFPLPVLFLPVARLLGGAVTVLMSVISVLARRFGIVIPLSGAAAGIVSVSLSAVAVAYLIASGKNLRRVCLSCAAAVSAITLAVQAFGASGGGFCAELLSSGRNDAVLASSDGENVLFDVGNGAAGALKNILRGADGICGRLDALVLTHTHKRHISAVTAICETYFVDFLYIPEPQDENEALIAAQIAAAAARAGTETVRYERGDSARVAEFDFTVRRPEYLSRSTHPLVGFSVSGETGDLIYVGSSLCEVCDISDLGENCAVIFGGHGPIAKSPVCKTGAAAVMTGAAAADVEKLTGEELPSAVADSAVIRFAGGACTVSIKE